MKVFDLRTECEGYIQGTKISGWLLTLKIGLLYTKRLFAILFEKR